MVKLVAAVVVPTTVATPSCTNWLAAAGVKAAAAAGAAAYSGAQQVFGAAKNVSWLLVVFGFAHYLLRLYQGPQWYVLLFSLTLLVLSAYALAAKVQKDQFAIIFPMLALTSAKLM